MAVRQRDLSDGLLAALARAPLLSELTADERETFLACAELLRVPARARVRGGPTAPRLAIVLDGTAIARREGLALRHLAPGDHLGTLGVATGDADEVVTAETPLVLAQLAPRCWDDLARTAPALALKIALAFAARLGGELAALTDEMGLLLRGRSVPRAREVTVHVLGEARRVPTGTRVRELVPTELDGALVVAGLLGQKPVSLATPVFTDCTVQPLTVTHWEGRQIYAQSVGLLLLEAAHRIAPHLRVRMGASRGTRQVVQVIGPGDREELAVRLTAEMERLAAADHPFRQEYWSIDEAASHFRAMGWDDAARLLRIERQATVRLVSCGELYALSMGPLLPSTGPIAGFRVSADGDALSLQLGARDPRNGHTLNGQPATMPTPPPPRDGDMATAHERWLAAMGVTSVGAFAELCVSGQVSQLIRVAEGFHEKRIGEIADRIAAARDRIRIIAIAGPSSSGKTTLIKRLNVQLQIDRVTPVGISLDDYYVDRERTPLDARGERDYETIDAIDLALLQDHVRRLLAGEEVRTAHYDFLTGKSHPEGGPPIRLRPGDVLLLEGIHGLNPRLLGRLPRPGELFRIFVHPATTLPFDALNRVSATDVRLLRRIVRDRHHRGATAADNIVRWPAVQAGEREHIYPYQAEADAVFDSALAYEPAVLKVYAERYLLEVPPDHPAYPTALRLRYLVDRFVSIYPDHVPPNSLIREFIGGSGFEY